MKKLLVTALVFINMSAYTSVLDDIDKPPGGAHAGQMIILGFASIGLPFGTLMDSEESFIDGSFYTFEDVDTTKMVDLLFLSFNFGFSFEYMPIDNFGIKARVRNDLIVERTLFGSAYRNWNEVIFSAYSFTLGVPYHFTVRKNWDVAFSPYVGYYTGKIQPAPVAGALFDGFSEPSSISVSGLLYGSELNALFFFGNGFVLSFGIDWSYFNVDAGGAIGAVHPQTGKEYSSSGSQSFHTVNLVISAGYAFSN